MALARLHLKPLADGEKIHFTDLIGMGRGRTFWVMAATATGYAQFFADHNVVDPLDKTNSVYNTVDAAISACTAGRGDVVYVTEGHTETVTATSIAHDVAGVTVIGLGSGQNRPTFTYGAAAATITISGANGGWVNCRFVANFLDVASAFTLGAAKGFTLQGNEFTETSSTLNFLSIVTTGATDNDADDLVVRDNLWIGLNTTPLAFISILAAESGLLAEDNSCFLDATSGGEFITLAAKIISAARIRRNNHIVVGATGTTTGIFLTGSGTTSKGVIHDNFCSSLDTTTELMFTAGTGLDYFRNEYTGVADKSGYILPAIDSAA